MFDPKQLLDQFLGGQGGNAAGTTSVRGYQRSGGGIMDRVGGYARDNPMLTGGVAGGLAGLLLGRGIGGDLLKYGGMAVIGGLAYKAYRDYQASQQRRRRPPPATARRTSRRRRPIRPSRRPTRRRARCSSPRSLIVAMIAAAKADGHIDAEERGRIYQRLEEGGLQPEEVAFLQRELTEPVDIERIVAGARNKEEAVEIYAASLMAVRSDTPQEREYLATLAGRLKLEPGLVQSIEKTVEAVAIK